MISVKRQREEIHAMTRSILDVNIETYINKYLYDNPKYQDPKKLNKHEWQVFSQNGEDGIIAEIFKRIGTTNKFFVEFGVGKDAIENNTVNLLLSDWGGVWMEGNPKTKNRVEKKFKKLIDSEKLKIKTAFVNASNVENLFTELGVPKEFDLLSLDIDGNDYWVWEAIKSFSPRVIVMEYNAVYGPYQKWIMKYNPDHCWDGSIYFGASLKSYELLGTKKGYKLVGCNFTGSNAFFVREDCVKDEFLKPFTSENHFEPIREFIARRRGNFRVFGEFETE